MTEQKNSDSYYLEQTLRLAEARRGFCAPNPAVGALLVKADQIIAEGAHYASGHPHAEVEVLKTVADDDIADSILYVSLEPCCHQGKTPACTDLLIDRGVKRVVYGFADPNPLVAGKGQSALNDAGISCQQLELATITHFYRSYTHWHKTGLPWVTAKIALSADNKIAGKNGTPCQITGPKLQRVTHQRRKLSDGILTTVQTILKDNPQLNNRLVEPYCTKPLYILDSQLRMPLEAKVFKTAEKLTLFYGEMADKKRLTALQAKGIDCKLVRMQGSGLCLLSVLRHIGSDGLHDLWVEAGACCFNSFFKERLLNEAHIYLAPDKNLGPDATEGPALSLEELSASATNCVESSCGNDILYQLIW